MTFRLFLFILTFFTLSLTTLAKPRGYENFHEIHHGKFYRSAQMHSIDIEHYIKKHGIRTIINLRGANPEEEWYQEELEVANRLQVQYDTATSYCQSGTY